MTNQVDKIRTLTAKEMALAEQTGGVSIATLEDPMYPKVRILAALGWVVAKRDNKELTFDDYADTHTLDQIVADLGLDQGNE